MQSQKMVKNFEKYEDFSSIIRHQCFCGLIVDWITSIIQH